MHPQQQEFCESVKASEPEFFSNVEVVDFGSLDINGNNRYLFTDYKYTGIDVGEGDNVDVVCRAHEYSPTAVVDVVVSTEMLEHDEHWKKSLRQMYDILRPGGLLLITCAHDPRPEHGTRRTTPHDAPFIGDYYRNLSFDDVKEVFDLETEFSRGGAKVNLSVGDLYFWGIKGE